MRHLRRFVLFVLLLSVTRANAQPKPELQPELRVATREVAPFVMRKDGQSNRELTGFSIDLWDAIAAQLRVKFRFSVQPGVAAQIAAVRGGRADLSIAATSITSDRDRLVDFSQPFYDSGLQILVRGGGSKPSLLDGLGQVLASPLLKQFALAVLLLMLVPAHLVWFLERRSDQNILRSKRYFPGIFDAMWWTVSCLATQSEEMPKTPLARVLAVVWMFFAIIFTAYVTAALTANLTLDALHGDIQGPGDLPGKRVATVAGSTAETYLQSEKVQSQKVANIADALRALQAKKVDAVVYDAPILNYYASHAGKGKAEVVGAVFRHENYGIVLPNGSPWRKRVNFALLTLRENGTYDQINTKWFGDPTQ